MGGKYYTKEDTVYKFKHQVLMKEEHLDATNAQKELLWKIFLLSLRQLKKVSRYQANHWTYPKKELSKL